MIEQCENHILGKLKAPSAYKRIKATVAIPDEKKHRQTVYIDYDAPNAFGVPIRGLEVCDFPYGLAEAKIRPLDDAERNVMARAEVGTEEGAELDNMLGIVSTEPECCMPTEPVNGQ